MTTNIAFASSDGYLTSSSTSYATAQGGSGIAVNTGATTLRVGQNKVGSTYEIYEAFLQFPYSLDANVVRVSAYFDFFQESVLGSGVARDMGVRSTVWGTLDTGDWKTVSGISALDRYGLAGGVHAATAKHIYASEEILNGQLDIGGTVQVVAYTSRFTGSDIPTGAEYGVISSAESSNDPRLVWTTVPIHSLVRVGAAQVQLSDGRHVFLEASTGGDTPTISIKLHDGTTATTLFSNVITVAKNFGSSNQAMQSVALIRGGQDNLYLISHRANLGNNLNVIGFEKTGASTWAERASLSAAMPSHTGVINNLVGAWHNVGSEGTILVVGSHETDAVGSNPINQMFFALLNCANVLNGSGNLLRASGDAFPGLVSATARPTDLNNFLNEVGSCLDIAALPDSNDRGVLVSQSREAGIGDYAPVSVVRYILNSTGTAFLDMDGGQANPIQLWGTKDAGAKVRVLPISPTQWAVVTLDRVTNWGPIIHVFQNFGSSSEFNDLGGAELHSEGIASLPAPSAMDSTYLWDAVYQPDSNKIWFYYFHTTTWALMRTAFDLNTYQAVKNEIQVAATVGAGGSINHAIRVQRGLLTESEVLIAVANKTAGGAQSTIYLVDRLNVAPNAPTLVDKLNYDATASNLFSWLFQDPNVGDSQTAYEFQIDNADTAASVVATGKITSTSPNRTVTGSTLSNGINYRWRVRTWDTSDEVGAWSAYDFFSTSAGGSVNITQPPSDNPAGVINDTYTVAWTTSNTTQQDYKVRVVRTSNEVQLSDTGWVASGATSHQISGLLSDVEYRIEVTVRNAALISTNTATRMITADYNEPEVPLVAISADGSTGRILIDIVNPAPQGDRPEVTLNQVQRRLVGTSTWTTIAEVVTNGSYQDFSVASDTAYEYQVVGVGSTGSIVSAITEATLTLMGVWLHVPSDPAGSARNYMFGSNQRTGQLQTYSLLSHFAGREDPVADFAHYQGQSYSITVDIPYGDDYYDQVDGLYALQRRKQTLVLRDNRRRFAFGVMSDLGETDVAIGTQMTFTFSRVDFNESVL